MKWAEQLGDNRAIADYIERLSPYEICKEQIEDEYIGCRAVLKWRALDTLIPGEPDINIVDEARQKVCDTTDLNSMPPLLVDGDKVADGNHRLRTLRKSNKTHFWVYEIQ